MTYRYLALAIGFLILGLFSHGMWLLLCWIGYFSCMLWSHLAFLALRRYRESLKKDI